MMKSTTRAWIGTLLLALGASVGMAMAANAPPQQQTVGAKVGKPLSEAHAAMLAEKWDDALALLQQAQAVPNKTDFENYQIDELTAFVQVRKADYTNAAATFERGLNSAFFPAEKLEERLRVLLQLNYEIKNYPKAVEFGKKLLGALKQPDSEVSSVVGRAQYLSADYKGAIETMSRAIDEARAAGKPVEETWMQVQLSSYVETKNNEGVVATLEQLAVQFPKKKYWDDLFRVLKRQTESDARAQLNVYRLMQDAGFLTEEGDYEQAARIALRLGTPGEALALVQQAQAKKVFAGEDGPEKQRQLLQEAQSAAQLDRKALGTLEQEARASKSGEADVQLGIAFMSYGQYDKAVEALQRGQKKGGLKHGSEADLMLGRSLLKLNRQPEATAAFQRAVSNTKDELSQRLGTLAKLWLVYVQQPSVVST